MKDLGHIRPCLTFGLLEAHYRLGHFQPVVIFGLLTSDEIHGPYVAQRHIGPINDPYKNDDNLARPNSGLLKARVLGRRIYGPSEFRPVKDPHRKWATISAR